MAAPPWLLCYGCSYSPIQFGLNASYCAIDRNGCVTDGAGAHGNNEACTIRVNSAGLLTATHFDTEAGHDLVTIGGDRYEGQSGPRNVAVSAGSTFSWSCKRAGSSAIMRSQ